MRSFDFSKTAHRLWDTQTLSIVSRLHEYKGKQELFLRQKSSLLNKLSESAKLKSAVAGAKLDGLNVRETKIKELCTYKALAQTIGEEEVSGYRDCLKIVSENYGYIPLRTRDILELHWALYRYSDKAIGGKFKSDETKMQSFQTTQSAKKKAQEDESETSKSVSELCESFNLAIEREDIDPLLLIPLFIGDFLCLKPFDEGNGRMSRLLTELLLYRFGYVVGGFVSLEEKLLETEFKYRETREWYAVRWSEGQNDCLPFMKYLLTTILDAYKDFEQSIGIYEEGATTFTKVQKAVNEQNEAFKKSDIMKLVPTVGRASTENALKALVKEGVLIRHGIGRATYYTKA